MAARGSSAAEAESYMTTTAPGMVPSEAHHDAAEAAAHLATGAHLIGAGDPGLAGFFTGFTRYASPEDLIRYTGAELATLVKLVYAKIARRTPGQSLIVSFVPSAEDKSFARAETILVAVNDDMPFLYDSCTAHVRAQGFNIRAAFHPVISTAHDETGLRSAEGPALHESIIVLALEGVADETLLAPAKAGLTKVFDHVRHVVRDWKPMLARLNETATQLKAYPPSIADEDRDEAIAFLTWLADNHFTLLGARDYAFDGTGDGKLVADAGSGLGLLADADMRVVRSSDDRAGLTPAVREFLTQPNPLIITKTATRSDVHRRVHMDYIGVKTFDAKGQLKGERRFIGLFTSTAYSQLPSSIPLLRQKIAHVMAGSGLPHNSHDGKALAHILNSYPRDELFQIGEDELLATALGILNLGERPKVRVFLRCDRFDRYVSALVFVPRERYSGAVREKIHAILARAFDGRMSAAYPMLDDEVLARVHYIIGRNKGVRPLVDAKRLEDDIRQAIRTWEDVFGRALVAEHGESKGRAIARRYIQAFPPGYRDTFAAADAVDDVDRIEALLAGRAAAGSLSVHVYDSAEDTKKNGHVHLKLFVIGEYVPLSECLPVFENLGLKVIAEDAFPLAPLDGKGEATRVSLQNFLMERAEPASTSDMGRVRPLLEEAFHAVWLGQAESDGFNRLVVDAEVSWRDVTILRSVAKFLRQAGITFSQAYMENALAKNSGLATLLIDRFYTLHDPEGFAKQDARAKDASAIHQRIDAALEGVPSADDDRIIRAVLAVINAMLRTDFFQKDRKGAPKPSLAFKLDSRKLDMLPAPKPLVEIFVYSPEVEGVHLRFGRVARGGIRWSDRPEDFRTEILGLVKAQQVKNAVIVPVGAKGGFYPKQLPKGGTREAVQAAAIAAYKGFIGALLDLTDNIGSDGTIIPPEHILRYDGDDPYLVVAADKGTATFSDIANDIAIAHGFWLGDAFASGGSHGYDHKKMGITARGAWEAVKRHFREMGRDIQNEPFSCIGVGDMSGDVFGNAMLLSQQTKLVAAFDHRHIFVDPDPDAEAGWAERKRLFDLPRSSWDDYNKALISKGGGVFPRSAKEIYPSKEMKALFGLTKDAMTPPELIRALLTAKTDLLFFGGIGTYIKSSMQSQLDAGDRANDALRVNGREVRASVVGEGANLGVTQLGRIEYAREGGSERKGGKINTDAIDNSAGVDTSDHEVNLKILMSGPLRRAEIGDDQRDALLTEMTDDVARLVLKDNYDQTFAMSVSESTAARDLDAASRFIREQERAGKLDRAVEMLPEDEALRSLARECKGLTRPEIAVLLAYAKLDSFQEAVDSALPDDPYFHDLLVSYFPPLAAEKFKGELDRHRLKREIIATELANRVGNLAGPLFAHRMQELSNTPVWHAIRAFALADGAFGLSTLGARVAALDLKVPASVQNQIMADIAELLRRLGLWFIVQLPASAGIGETVKIYGAGVAALKGRFSSLVSPLESTSIEARIAAFKKAGVPDNVAEDAGVLPLLGAAPEIVLLSESHKVAIDAAAGAYFGVGALVGLDRLRALGGQVAAADHWDRLALRRIMDDLYAAQRLLAGEALGRASDLSKDADRAKGAAAVKIWSEKRRQDLERTNAFLGELERGGPPSIAKLALANSQIQKIAAGPV